MPEEFTSDNSGGRGQMVQPRRRGSFVLALVLVFAVGLLLGRYALPAFEFDRGPVAFVEIDEQGDRRLVFETFWEARDLLHQKYIGEINDEQLFYGAVRGLVAALDDPYTAFATPDETQQFEENISGSFSGIGAEIGIRNGMLTVIAPLSGSPAQEAGVRQGDVILAVDDEPITTEVSLNEAVQRIRGERGSEVVLSIAREGESGAQDIVVTRDVIEIESVKLTVEDGIGVIEVTNFNSDTADRFNAAAAEVLRQDVRGLIVDVRNNPGGFLDSAVHIASRFVPKGEDIVIERGNDRDSTKRYAAEGNPLLQNIPTVVVVNEGSASASEILAGALHDQLNVPIVGTQTFGKGSVQEFQKLSDGSSLRVTVAKWYTPNDRNIDEEGIAPTIEVEQDFDTDEDEQLTAARAEVERLLQ